MINLYIRELIVSKLAGDDHIFILGKLHLVKSRKLDWADHGKYFLKNYYWLLAATPTKV